MAQLTSLGDLQRPAFSFTWLPLRALQRRGMNPSDKIPTSVDRYRKQHCCRRNSALWHLSKYCTAKRKAEALCQQFVAKNVVNVQVGSELRLLPR